LGREICETGKPEPGGQPRGRDSTGMQAEQVEQEWDERDERLQRYFSRYVKTMRKTKYHRVCRGFRLTNRVAYF